MSRLATRHGSVVAHLAGCRTKAECPHQSSPEWLTCVEAAIARRGEWRAAAYGLETPIPRNWDSVAAPARAAVHGTIWGYRRGCRQPELCPNRYRDRPTCADARKRYLQEYRRRRWAEGGASIPHGTSNGYLLGCRAADCPRGDDGRSCREARAAYRRAGRRSDEAAALVPADEILRLVRTLREGGVSAREIARRTGTGRTTLSELMAGRRTQVTREVADRLVSGLGGSDAAEDGR